MHIVDPRKLDEMRELIDECVVEFAIANERSRSQARQAVAADLGYLLESTEAFGWHFATAFTPSELREARQIFSTADILDAMWDEIALRSRLHQQAATVEDAETAVLVSLLDNECDLSFADEEFFRIYRNHESPFVHPHDIWSAEVEFYWDGSELPECASPVMKKGSLWHTPGASMRHLEQQARGMGIFDTPARKDEV